MTHDPSRARPRRPRADERAPTLDTLRALGVPYIAGLLGFTATDRAVKPCPACPAVTRHPGRHDKRAAVGVTEDGIGWRCFECDAGGDAITFAQYALFGEKLGQGDNRWREFYDRIERVRSTNGEHGRQAVAPAPPSQPTRPLYPPTSEVLDLLYRCLRVEDDPTARNWADAAGLDRLDHR